MKHSKAVARLQPYVRELADLMKLRDWDILLLDELPDDEDAMASCECIIGRKIANIRISKGLHKLPPEKQRHALCHELIHVHFAPMNNPLKASLTIPAVDLYVSAMEYGVDAVADVLAPFLPLPPLK